jgi:hypothetical protein
LKYCQLIRYFRYVDDILIVYKNRMTNIHEILELFKTYYSTMTFTMEEEESNNRIKFIDITVQKTDNNISFYINRKPTATDTIIPNDSCHLPEQKMAAIR